MNHRKRTMNSMSRRAAVAMVASLGLTLAGPVTAAQAEDLVELPAVPLKPGCVSINPYNVAIETLLPEATTYVDGLRQDGESVTLDDVLAFNFPTPDGPGFLLTRKWGNTAFELCPVVNGFELTAIAIGIETPYLPVDTGISPGDSSTYNTNLDQEQNDAARKGRWRAGPDGCFETGVQNHSWRKVCWKHDTQMEDENPNRHYHQFFAEATGMRVEEGEKMTKLWVDAKPRTDSSFADQTDDGLPLPKADVGGTQDCVTYTEGEEDSVTASSGSPFEAGYTRTRSLSGTSCDLYQARNPSGTRMNWANIWVKADKSQGTTGTRHVAINMPIYTRQTDNRYPSWELLTGQHISVDHT